MIGVRSLPSIDENLLPRAGSAADRLAAAATPGILLSSGLAGQMGACHALVCWAL